MPEPTGSSGQILWSAAYETTDETTAATFKQRLGKAMLTLTTGINSTTGVVTAAGTVGSSSGGGSGSATSLDMVEDTARELFTLAAEVATGHRSSSNVPADSKVYVGVRIVTSADYYGSEKPSVKQIVGVANTPQQVTLGIGSATATFEIKPNEVWAVHYGGTPFIKVALQTAVPFTPPHF